MWYALAKNSEFNYQFKDIVNDPITNLAVSRVGLTAAQEIVVEASSTEEAFKKLFGSEFGDVKSPLPAWQVRQNRVISYPLQRGEATYEIVLAEWLNKPEAKLTYPESMAQLARRIENFCQDQAQIFNRLTPFFSDAVERLKHQEFYVTPLDAEDGFLYLGLNKLAGVSLSLIADNRGGYTALVEVNTNGMRVCASPEAHKVVRYLVGYREGFSTEENAFFKERLPELYGVMLKRQNFAWAYPGYND
jgi:hypothetical protein